MKLAVVGPSAEKWKPEQIPRIRIYIARIFLRHIVKESGLMDSRFIGKKEYELITLVSGHDFIGKLAEEIADELGIKKEIYLAEVNQWQDFLDKEMAEQRLAKSPLKGYRSRNIKIAEACDVLYCIVPQIQPKHKLIDDIVKEKNAFCGHCNMAGHPTNGGCWTMKYSKKLGKETHLVVIE